MEDNSNNQTISKSSWLDRLGHALLGEPRDREELIRILRDAEQRHLFDAHALAMLEGVLQVSELQVRDIMIPRAQMVVVSREADPKQILPTIIDSGHSRFPVVTDNPDEVVGILLAKDLLRIFGEETVLSAFNIREVLRPVVFVPKSKRLNVLLNEFRTSRNHIAIVVDEYGGVAGMVTIEDVLEQIVGEITDEHDIEEDSFVIQHADNQYTIKALLPIEEFNEKFDSDISDEEFDTIGGLVVQGFGHVPIRNEVYTLDRFQFTVIRADKRRVHLLRLRILPRTVERAETG
jgi:magnesium and cobalt transporter